jgi:hypothetical protein
MAMVALDLPELLLYSSATRSGSGAFMKWAREATSEQRR